MASQTKAHFRASLECLVENEKMMGWCTAWCKMLLFHTKTAMRVSCKFELARQKKMKEEREKNILAVWRLSGLVLLRCPFMPLVGHENTWRWMVLISLVFVRFWEIFFGHILQVHAIPIYGLYWLRDKGRYVCENSEDNRPHYWKNQHYSSIGPTSVWYPIHPQLNKCTDASLKSSGSMGTMGVVAPLKW